VVTGKRRLMKNAVWGTTLKLATRFTPNDSEIGGGALTDNTRPKRSEKGFPTEMRGRWVWGGEKTEGVRGGYFHN